MTSSTEVATGRYVYAIVRSADTDNIVSLDLHGLNDAEVTTVHVNDLAALTSQIVAEKLRPRRNLLAAHQNVVTTVSRNWDMLPVSFGLIADDEAELVRILENNADVLLEQLNRVGGQVEMNVSLRWVSESVFQLYVDKHPDLREGRDYVATGQASRDEMIELGRQFEQLLARERENYTEIVVSPLRSICSEIEPQPAQNEQQIVRLNCLIPRDRADVFNDAVHRLAEDFDEQFAFNLSGPWPPYSFVKIALSAE